MITHYYRPQQLEEALALLSQPDTFPLGGGTILTKMRGVSFSVVDLQDLVLDFLRISGDNLEIGATTTLQALFELPFIPRALKVALELEAPLNLRTIGTVAGALVTCDGRSPLGTVLLALDTKCYVVSKDHTTIRLGNLLPIRDKFIIGKLITHIEIPLNISLAFTSIARTPADKSIVSVALAKWPSGRTRLALGGFGIIPTLAMDGNNPSGLEQSAQNAFSEATDEWASAEYRMEMASILCRRCREEIASI